MNTQIPMRDLDPALLRAFVSVVDAGNFSRAAARLNRSQSALSMQIKRLEEALDAVLFDRATRPAVLTAAGEKLVPYARQIITLNDDALEDIRSDSIAGSARLGVMEDLAVTHLAPILDAFRKRHPRVRTDVETGLTAVFLEGLGSSFDIVLAMTGVDHAEGELLFRGRSCWVAAPDSAIGPHDTIDVALSHPQCHFRRWATSALERANRRWQISMVSTNISAIAAAVRQGNSISVMKDVAIPSSLTEIRDHELLPRLPDYEIRLFRSPSVHRGSVRVLADQLKQSLPIALKASLARRQDAVDDLNGPAHQSVAPCRRPSERRPAAGVE